MSSLRTFATVTLVLGVAVAPIARATDMPPRVRLVNASAMDIVDAELVAGDQRHRWTLGRGAAIAHQAIEPSRYRLVALDSDHPAARGELGLANGARLSLVLIGRPASDGPAPRPLYDRVKRWLGGVEVRVPMGGLPQWLVLNDRIEVAEHEAAVRLLHAALSTRPVTLVLANAEQQFGTRAAYAGVSDLLKLPAGTYRYTLGPEGPLGPRERTLELRGGTLTTLVLHGDPWQQGAAAVIRLVDGPNRDCVVTDPPGGCSAQ